MPGIGRMWPPCDRTQASASCDGDAPFRVAISFTSSTRLIKIPGPCSHPLGLPRSAGPTDPVNPPGSFCQAPLAPSFAETLGSGSLPICLLPRLAPNSNFLHPRSQFHSTFPSLSSSFDLSLFVFHGLGTFVTICGSAESAGVGKRRNASAIPAKHGSAESG